MALGALVAALGPLFGQLVLIVSSAFLGALLAMSKATTESMSAGILMVLRGVVLGVLLAGGLSFLWIDFFKGRYPEMLAIVSALVGFRTEWALEKLKAASDRMFGGNA